YVPLPLFCWLGHVRQRRWRHPRSKRRKWSSRRSSTHPTPRVLARRSAARANRAAIPRLPVPLLVRTVLVFAAERNPVPPLIKLAKGFSTLRNCSSCSFLNLVERRASPCRLTRRKSLHESLLNRAYLPAGTYSTGIFCLLTMSFSATRSFAIKSRYCASSGCACLCRSS